MPSFLRSSHRTVGFAVVAGALAFSGSAAFANPGSGTGPSSSDAPYLVRHVPGVTLKSILTTGDEVGDYRMAGVPDGLGAFDNGDGTFTLLMAHEFLTSEGVVRDHGAQGSFIDKLVIEKGSLRVLSGEDLIKKVYLWDGSSYVETPGVAFSRFCSADLPARSALYNPASGKGYDGHIFLNGEEDGPPYGPLGRAFGHVVETGNTYELAAIGNDAYENVVANPGTGDETVVAATSDGGDQAVNIYHGTKTTGGNPVEKAGLNNGTAFKIYVPGLVDDGATPVPGGPMAFELASAGDPFTAWYRPEDAAWDPSNPNDLYFVTTASMTKHSRLWKVSFTDASQPELGGTVQMVLEGPSDASDLSGPHMMDNITINHRGQALIQEDPGGNAYLAGIWQVDLATGKYRRIVDHDPAKFTTGGADFWTTDEESSGIIPAPFLGEGKYLFVDQPHVDLADEELVQRGQLLLLRVPAGQKIR